MGVLKFGILGLSPGNGHPYSWSAIFNGYDAKVMVECPFPSIPEYLSRQSFPDDAIAEARVTHVWTQAADVSKHVAAAARIPHVVSDYREMIGQVDAILLARDDAESHFEMAAPFLDAGLPIYIDKPLALSVGEAKRLYARQQRPGQIFTCSALAYARELQLSPPERASLGRLRFIDCVTVKDWDKYAVHVIDPLCDLVAGEGRIASMQRGHGAVQQLQVRWESGLEGRVTALGSVHGTIALRLYGEQDWRELVFHDSFHAFRSALQHFTDIAAGKVPPQEPSRALQVVSMIEAGRSAAA